jgi:outer membrane protein OmpA-like peptidoglycan-associated protein
MLLIRQILFLSIFTFCFILSDAQTIEGNNDCTYFKEIIIPFNYQVTPNATGSKPMLNQTVFYSYRDQFSYWYKIVVKENAKLRFKINSINDSDEYVVYVYQYNEKDFCDKVYYQKAKPVKPSFFTGTASTEDPYDLTEKSFLAKKDNVYYISVLNTSLNNCGHNFYLINEKDTLKVKALHLPCKRDLATLSVKDISINAPAKKQDSIIAKIDVPALIKKDSASALPPTLFCKVIDAKKKTSVAVKPVIIDQTTAEELTLTRVNKDEWFCRVQKGRSYKIKCTAFGYKNAVQTITVDHTSSLELLLEPFKEGDNFIMKSIYFFPNTYALKKVSSEELQKLLQYLLANENVSIEIQGHTNGDHRIARNKAYSALGEEWNFEGSAKTLSQKRAETIKNYLKDNGIKSERLEAKGYGGKKPIIKDPQTNEEGQLNIRVEMVILKS